MEAPQAGNKAGRDKYWSEIDVNEKSERLRNKVKGLEWEIRRLSEILLVLQDHSHNGNNITIPLHSRMVGDSGGKRLPYPEGRGKDDVYF